jgi:hypothetical protein
VICAPLVPLSFANTPLLPSPLLGVTDNDVLMGAGADRRRRNGTGSVDDDDVVASSLLSPDVDDEDDDEDEDEDDAGDDGEAPSLDAVAVATFAVVFDDSGSPI